MHGEPHRQRRNGEARQHTLDQRFATREPGRREADAHPCPQRLPEHEVVVAADSECIPVNRLPHRPKALDNEVVLVEADEVVAKEVTGDPRHASAPEVVHVRERADRDAADAPGDERDLLGPHHAYRDVGLPAQQVGDGVRRDHLDGDAGFALPQTGENRREQVHGHDLASPKFPRAMLTWSLYLNGLR